MMQVLRRILQSTLASLGLLTIPSNAYANFTLNLGYQNPVGSTVGLNLLYLAQPLSFEIGVGWIQASTDPAMRLALGGDLDLKYFFSASGLRPYLQAGLGYGIAQATSKTHSSTDLQTFAPFAGLGLFAGEPSFHAYVALNTFADLTLALQGGLGIDL